MPESRDKYKKCKISISCTDVLLGQGASGWCVAGKIVKIVDTEVRFPVTYRYRSPWVKISPRRIFYTVMNEENLQLLVTRVMPYGKYKGRLIADLPGHYLNWFAREGFPSGEIGRLLALMQELDHNGLSSLLEPLRKR
jgi:hypothetical protein